MEILIVLSSAVIVILAIFTGYTMWQHNRHVDRPIRFGQMLARLGMPVQKLADSELAEHLPTAARLCHLCQSAGACDHLLAAEGKLNEPPEFCPNASYIRLAQQSAQLH